MLTCDELGIPQRLRKESHQIEIDKDFKKDVFLYRRFPPDIEIVDKKIIVAMFGKVFKPPFNISVNRSHYCRFSTDVLYSIKSLPHMFDYGVIEAIVEDIDGYTFKSNDSTIKFSIEHDPELCMYPHSIIVVIKDGKRIDKKISSNTLKADVREHLGKLFEKICHYPNSSFIPVEEKSELEEVTIQSLTFFQKYIKPFLEKILKMLGWHS